jgi:hypothetical protein
MENVRKRILFAIGINIVIYLLWILHDFFFFLANKRESDIIITIICILVSIPLFLFSLFFIHDDYKVMSDRNMGYIEHYGTSQVVVAVSSVLVIFIGGSIFFIIGISIKCIAIFVTYHFANKIYKETLQLIDIDDTRKVEQNFQDAIIVGVTVLIIAAIMFAVAINVGVRVISIFVLMPSLLFVILCNYVKFKLIEQYNILERGRALIIDNLVIVFSLIMVLILSLYKVEDSVVLFIAVVTLVPIIKTNKRIGKELERIRENKRE